MAAYFVDVQFLECPPHSHPFGRHARNMSLFVHVLVLLQVISRTPEICMFYWYISQPNSLTECMHAQCSQRASVAQTWFTHLLHSCRDQPVSSFKMCAVLPPAVRAPIQLGKCACAVNVMSQCHLYHALRCWIMLQCRSGVPMCVTPSSVQV